MTLKSSPSNWSLNSNSPIVQARRLRRTSSLGDLPNLSGDINVRDAKGRTPLFYAARHGETEDVKRLLEAGCDPNIPDNRCNLDAKNILGQSPLMRAVLYDDLEMVKFLKKGEGHEKICEYLMRSGADVNLVDNLGQSALYIAVHNPGLASIELVRKVIKSGYDVEKDSRWLKKSELNLINHEDMTLFKKIKSKFSRRGKSDKENGKDDKILESPKTKRSKERKAGEKQVTFHAKHDQQTEL
ncbi:hypothetical protein KUTeg_005746 [Tegillarca granosa]|uniref:Uncharacterized protein n=1 Tax=Tegillarca granosa TaxID=220873 RepID=A0ABQ9FHC7_TEGGR|nr:hypothetical protein KUTeg_005746 [Tegillarca granosa]